MENTIRMKMKRSRGWRDWTNLLPRTFGGESREKILTAWEDHFRRKRIITRRIWGERKRRSRDGEYHHRRDWVKLQIWMD